MNATEKARQWLIPQKDEYASVLDYGLDLEQVAILCGNYARAAELAAYEECCKAVCKGCNEGLACLSHPHQNGDHLDHDRDGFLLRCAATDIRSLPRFQELQKSKS
jgi:hypothetical protein